MGTLGTLGQHEFAFGFCGSIGVEISRVRRLATGSVLFEHSCFNTNSSITMCADYGKSPVQSTLHYAWLCTCRWQTRQQVGVDASSAMTTLPSVHAASRLKRTPRRALHANDLWRIAHDRSHGGRYDPSPVRRSSE